jgi:pyruvate dehydrogenase (quinone)
MKSFQFTSARRCNGLTMRFTHSCSFNFENASFLELRGMKNNLSRHGKYQVPEGEEIDEESDKIEEMNTSDVLVNKLLEWEVEFIFGIIGDGINPIVESIRKKKNKIKFITVRHEESAAFMASGYAKYTGKIGVCLATSGPGAVHLMNGLYDAQKDHVPVLAITGAPASYLAGTDYTQEINVMSLMEDVAVYNQVVTGPKQALTVVDVAIRSAINHTGVAHLNFSRDIQEEKLDENAVWEGMGKSRGDKLSLFPLEVPERSLLEKAAEEINKGNKIAILAGQGARTAKAEIIELAEKLAAPVIKALLGKDVIPDDSEYTTGGIGPLGTEPSAELMKECDVLIILGSNMPYLTFYPEKAVGIQVDHEPTRIGLRYPVEFGLIGDVKVTLKELLPLLNRKKDRNFLQKYVLKMNDWRDMLKMVEGTEGKLIKPQYLVAQVSRLLDENATVSIDTGAHTVFTARHWQLRGQQQMAVSGNLASMGPGLPYAIAAQLAFPGRQCVAMVGDGGFSMLMAELVTASRYQLPVKIILFKNNELSQDVYEQEAMGNPVFGGELSPIDFVKVAEACGAEGYRCSESEDLLRVLEEAFASDAPTLVEVLIDPRQAPAAPDGILENRF